MADKITNQELRRLLLELGFVPGEPAQNNHRAFRHPGSGCVIVLPDNRDEDNARRADVAGVRDHLAQQGHLDEVLFDRFLIEGKLPVS